MLKRVWGIGALCLILGGCGELFGTVVDYPKDAVTSMIYNMPNSANMMGFVEQFPGTTKRIRLSPAGVIWTYAVYGKDECHFTAHIKRESDTSSVVWSDVEELGNGDRAYLCDAVRIIGEESIAATLEGRPADEIGTQKKLAVAVAGNIGSVEKSIFEEVNRTINAKPDDCYLEQTSADQAACNGDRSLKAPKDDDR